jgi:hypothetical protein
MNYERINKSFSAFIRGQSDYDEHQKDHILILFTEPYVKKTFILSIILLGWSLLGAVLDSLFFGGGLVTLFMLEEPSLMVFLPALIYFVTNLVSKIIFVKTYLKEHISWYHSLLAAVPYIGSNLLLANLLKKHPIFLKALVRYLKYLRKRGLGHVCTSFIFTKKTTH